MAGKALVLVEVLAFEGAVDRTRLSDRVKSCGQAPRDKLVQLVKHEPPRRDSFFLEENRHRGAQLSMGLRPRQLTSEIFFYFLKVSI